MDGITVECKEDVNCRVTISITANCPIKDEIDAYDVIIEWAPDGNTLEKHAIESLIKQFDGSELTQEKLCASVYSQIPTIQIEDLCVTIQDTKHMDMVVRKP